MVRIQYRTLYQKFTEVLGRYRNNDSKSDRGYDHTPKPTPCTLALRLEIYFFFLVMYFGFLSYRYAIENGVGWGI